MYRVFATFARWLRSNAEHYLLQDAQLQTAKEYGANRPVGPRTLKDRFWRQVFVPIYRLLPWSVRRSIMQTLPGSTRRAWPAPNYERRPPGI